ncbi:hypothetical protein [Microbacterium foliorum]|uniref:hypothetical protein n=1 Tax=Microbacterium foliorum TaxID=104336 RepID=UPI001DDDB5F8|nr:hypothetical protein [Microbacterium foliorum]CAH0157161.1 hypothetical protein SRABI03_00913 [Microbacterium foliorum]CAH0172805.1 hypothetical protein SRABI44_01248 [Microbacterium foliorum]
MGSPSGFEFTVRGDDVVIRHHGTTATVLRGARARDFLAQVAGTDAQPAGPDAQLLMARITGDYRRGNERIARRHPRNAG